MPPAPIIVALAASAALLAAAASAQAQAPAACAETLRASPAPSFDDDKHRLWYQRFWTGACSPTLGFSCMSGAPNWTEAVSVIAAQAAPAARPALVARACRLGVKVGAEWARDNAVRRIDTGDVRRYGGRLSQPGDPAAALTEIEQAAGAKLNGR